MNRCHSFSSGGYIEKRGNVEPALCNKFNFVKHKSGKGFMFQRPTFKSGIENIDENNKKNVNIENKRTGIGNYNIVRNNYLASPIRGREAIDFEKLQLQDIQDAGVKVQLGDKTLEKLFGIQVEDKTDKSWIDEKDRRLAAGETEAQINANPPFGRPQRKVRKNVNFASQGLALDDKLELIKSAIQNNNVETKEELAEITARISIILGEMNSLEQLTEQQIAETKVLINRLNVPKNYITAGLKHRIWSWKEYQDDMGLVNLFLLNKAPKQFVNYPVINDISKKRIKLSSILPTLKAGGAANQEKYLDLASGFIISKDDAIDLANQGVDNGIINGNPAPEFGWDMSIDIMGLPFAPQKPLEIDDPNIP